MEIFKMSVVLKWAGSCRNISKVTSFSTLNANFGKNSD